VPDEPATHVGSDATDRLDPPAGADVKRLHGEEWQIPADGSRGRDVARATIAPAAALLVVWLSTRVAESPVRGPVAFLATAVGAASLGHVAVRARAGRRAKHPERAVILGAGEVGQLVARKLLRHPEYGIDLIGFVDRPPRRWRQDVRRVPVLGEAGDLRSIIATRDIGRVIVAFSGTRDSEMLGAVRSLVANDVRVDVVPRMFEIIGPNARLPNLEGIPLISIAQHHRSATSKRVKRGIDIVGACAALVLVAPVFLWAAWRIPRDTPGPVLFRQKRLGRHMREFTMLKFRTMRTDTDKSLHHAYLHQAMNGDGDHVVDAGELYKVDHGDVVTRTGRWLRRTSLDELPQLINVLRGEMSLVGPRPCLSYETEYFAPHHYDRFLAPAGITGLWQVTARAHASFAEALEMDVVYVRDWSLRLDLSLLLRTPVEVLRQRRATS
jgi:exopolysaccharide biosynthesis polyprenyl glycosylphosphotransferase